MSAKHTIAWLPGDGVGVDVMDAARLVLDRVGLDADYITGTSAGSSGAARATRSPPARSSC